MTDVAHNADTARRPDLLNLVTLWSFAAAFFWTIGLVAAALFAYPFSPGYEGTTLTIGDVFGMVVGTLLLLGCVGVSIASGVGLLKEKSWGRAGGIANAVLSLFLVPFGTVVGILALIYLLRPEVSARFAAVPQTHDRNAARPMAGKSRLGGRHGVDDATRESILPSA